MEKRSYRDGFTGICDELEEKYQQGENEVAFIRKYIITNKLNENYDVLLKIKAEAEDCDANSFLSLIVCIISMFFTGCGIVFQVFSKMPDILYNIMAVVYLVIDAGCLIYILKKYFGHKDMLAKKWRKYVLVSVNEIIRELQEKQSKMQKDKQNTMQGNKNRRNKNTSHRK